MMRSSGRGKDNRPAWLGQQERNGVLPIVETVQEDDADARPKKRARTDPTTTTQAQNHMEDPSSLPGEEEEEDPSTLEQLELLNGDEFLDPSDVEAEAARQRRLKRKQRLERSKADEMEVEVAKETTTTFTIKKPAEEDVVEPTNARNHTGDDDDDFDMFSSSISPPPPQKTTTKISQSSKQHHQQDWDDEEGYYKATIGEEINLEKAKFRVQGIVGKGVFSTVVKCETLSGEGLPQVVALKLIRSNETMAKAALDEMAILQKLRNAPNICSLLLPQDSQVLEHRGHTTLVFDYFPFNLRNVLRKYGRNVGLSLIGVKAYFVQLLQALIHLSEIIHADLKPDNILVSQDLSTLKLCDFGSAFEEKSSMPTPYLVSRFYRAPEIILGLQPTQAVDLWSVATTVAELFLGRVLFDGRSNNDMLLQFMKTLGPFSNRILRQHLNICSKSPIPPHFAKTGGSYEFQKVTLDRITGEKVTLNQSLQQYPTKPLQQVLLQQKSTGDSRIQLMQLSDLLTKCMALDPQRRIALKDALRHSFFQQDASSSKVKEQSTT